MRGSPKALKRVWWALVLVGFVVLACLMVREVRTPEWYRLIRPHVVSQRIRFDSHVYEPGNGTDPRSIATTNLKLDGPDSARVQAAIKADCPESQGWKYASFAPLWDAGVRIHDQGFTAERYPDKVTLGWSRNDSRMTIVERREASLLQKLRYGLAF